VSQHHAAGCRQRVHHTGDKAAGVLMRNAVSRLRFPSLRRAPAHPASGAVSPFKSLSPGLRQAQPVLLSSTGVAFRNKFFPAIPLLSIRT